MDTDELTHMPSDATDSLDTLVVFNILRSHNYVEPYVDNGLRELRLTCVQLNFLLLLLAAGKGGLPLSEVGRRLVVSKANITGLADRLEHRGLMRREHIADRRVVIAALTPQGRSLVGGIFPAHRRLFAEMVDCLSVKEKRSLIKLLTRLRKGLREKWRKSGTWRHGHAPSAENHKATPVPAKG